MEKRGTSRFSFGRLWQTLVVIAAIVLLALMIATNKPIREIFGGSGTSKHDQELLNVLQWGDRFNQKEQGKVGEEVYTIYTDTVTGVMYVKIGDGITPIVDMDGGYARF